jgi:hypothetical protein
MNPKILKKVQLKIKAALQIIDRYTDFDIALRFGRSEAMEKAKDGTVTTVSIGVGNALAHGKADFESKRILAAYNLCKNVTNFPQDVELKKTAKGYQLTIKKQKSNDNNENQN